MAMKTPTEKTDVVALTVGQTVVVHDVNEGRSGIPAGGRSATVTKVGRKLVTVKYDDSTWLTQVFRLEDRSSNDTYRHQWFRTLEQEAEHKRYQAAGGTLREHGVEFRVGHRPSPSLEQIEELAEVVSKWRTH